MTERSLSVRRHVAAPPDRVYEAVSDLGRMASWSDEYVGSWRFGRGVPRPGEAGMKITLHRLAAELEDVAEP